MFLGTHLPKLDEKGRLILPAKFRDQLTDGVVVTKGQERCLYVFPIAEFLRRTERLAEAPLSAKGARDYGRFMFGSAHQEQPDKQGRITLPATLREYAGLERDCALIGTNTHAEIWDSAAWETYMQEQESEFVNLREEVVPGVL